MRGPPSLTEQQLDERPREPAFEARGGPPPNADHQSVGVMRRQRPHLIGGAPRAETSVGVGYPRMGASERGTDLSIAGNSGSLGIALGGAVNSHLIIYGTLIDCLDRRPTGTIHGPSLN